jgi:hypothetical protein
MADNLTVYCVDLRPISYLGLIGFASVYVPELGMTIRNIAVYEGGDRTLLSPSIDRSPEPIAAPTIRSVSLIEFDRRQDADAFGQAVLNAVDAYLGRKPERRVAS